MSAKAAVPDAWEDDWEAQADVGIDNKPRTTTT
jgi:hypothetical protein